VLGISLGIVVTTAVLITGAFITAGIRPELALLFGAIATSTAPAATVDVVRQLGTKGNFSETLLDIVAIDDAWGLLIFTLILAATHALIGDGEALGYFVLGAREIGGRLGGAPRKTRRWMGVALLPQAGIAIGMALLAGQHFPAVQDTVVSVVLSATVVFEILGPIATRWAVLRAERSH